MNNCVFYYYELYTTDK